MMNPHELPYSFMSLEDDSDFFTWRVVFEGPADSLWQTQGVAVEPRVSIDRICT